MPIILPVDFEEKAKTPPSPDGRGYPAQISAKDLMANFNALANLLPDGLSKNDIIIWDGTKWALHSAPAPSGDFTLQVSDGAMKWDTAASGLPSPAYAGDMLYHNGSEWVVLDAPTGPGSGEIVVLKHDGTTPSWVTLTEQSLDICVSGSPGTVTVLKQ